MLSFDFQPNHFPMKLNNAIKQAFSNRDIHDLIELYAEINALTSKKYKVSELEDLLDEYLAENSIVDIAINWNDEKVIYREQFFHNTSFKISLTQEEFEEKRLYVGHRLSPFIAPNIPFAALQLQDAEGKPFQLKENSLPLTEMYQYISMLPPYSANQPTVVSIEEVKIEYYDLKEWMIAYDFEPKDMLLVVPVDYPKHIFRIEKLSARYLAEQTFITQHKNKRLTEALEDVLNWYPEPIPVDLAWFWAFALFEPKELLNTGSSLGPFISQHEEFGLHTMAHYSFIHYQDYEERMMEETLMEMENPEQKVMGEATDLDGIFDELENSYSETFVAAKLLLQLHQNQDIDPEELLDILFGVEHPFYSAKQAGNFEKALNKLAKKMKKLWSKQRLSLPVLRLLTKLVNFRIRVKAGIHEMDAALTDIADVDLAVLNQLHTLDMIAEQMLSLIVYPEDGQTIDADSAVMMISQVENMYSNFQEGLDYILSQL